MVWEECGRDNSWPNQEALLALVQVQVIGFFMTCFETETGEGGICFELLNKGQIFQKSRFMEDIDA
jgi:hypothetical protein